MKNSIKMCTPGGAIFAVALCLGAMHPAYATLITSAAPIASPTVITFAPFGGAGNRVNGVGPTQIGTEVGEDIVFTSGSVNSFVGDTIGYGLEGNGSWNMAFGPFTGSNSNTMMTYTFNDGPINAVGGFMNYSTGRSGAVLIEALGLGMVVLESFDLITDAPISTPGATNAGAFRGISRMSNDIVAFRYTGRFGVLDDLTFSRADAIPEPTTLALFGLSLAGLGFTRRKST
jgi:hypothetical protein